MSKLADAIRRSQRVEAAPMGFGAARAPARPTMLVGFLGAASQLAQAKAAGADLAVMEARLSDSELAALKAETGDFIVGVARSGTDSAAAGSLKASGVDFLLFDPETTPAEALLNEDLGYVLQLPAGADESFLRSLEPLRLEAVYLTEVPLPLTVARQIELGRIGVLSHKPLICGTEPDASGESLQCLRSAGVAVLLVQDPTGVAQLKATVASLPARKQRREERPVVSLPTRPVNHEEEEDDDDRLDRA